MSSRLAVAGLRQHHFTDWHAFPSMLEVEPGKYVLQDGHECLPLLFTLMAAKPASRAQSDTGG